MPGYNFFLVIIIPSIPGDVPAEGPLAVYEHNNVQRTWIKLSSVLLCITGARE